MTNQNTMNGTTSQGMSKSDLAATAQQSAQDAKQQVQQTAQSMQAQARDAANAQIAQASHGLNEFAQSVREFGQDLRGRNQGMMAQVTEQAAGQIERAAGYMQRDIGQMSEDVSSYATRQPVVFLAGAFMLGLLGARFLKSTGNGGTNNQPPRLPAAAPYDRSRYGYAGDMRGGAYPTSIGTLPPTTDDMTTDYPPTSGNGVL